MILVCNVSFKKNSGNTKKQCHTLSHRNIISGIIFRIFILHILFKMRVGQPCETGSCRLYNGQFTCLTNKIYQQILFNELTHNHLVTQRICKPYLHKLAHNLFSKSVQSKLSPEFVSSIGPVSLV
jgi:hypothetical protein